MQSTDLKLYIEVVDGKIGFFHLLNPDQLPNDGKAYRLVPPGFCGLLGQPITDFTAALEPTEDTARRMKTEEIISARRAAYREESDPLYFGAARGENTEEEWLSKVAEIKMRFPKP